MCISKKNEQEKERKENLKSILGPEIFSSMEEIGIFPSYIGRVRIRHCDEYKIFPLIGFGEKRPGIVLVRNEYDTRLIQLSV